jgi:putative FmdB family regulatory protein
MPLYVFKCEACEHEQEELMTAAEVKIQDNWVACEMCGEYMYKVPSAPNVGQPAFQMGAGLSTGEVVPGHFGKSAKKK